MAETLDIGPGTRVFEVDCGDGAFLIPLSLNGYHVGGIDADPAAIALAIASMPDGLFQAGPAASLDPAVPWDVVVCRSLAGAPDTNYIRGILARMFAKATHGVALLDVPDERRQWMLHALNEIGAKAIHFEDAVVPSPGDRLNPGESGESNTFHLFARV